MQEITALLDASAPGLGTADLVFVLGSTLPHPIAPAAEVMKAGLAPAVVVTGGPNRRIPAHVESEVHAELLRSYGVPAGQILIERHSTTSVGNVALARELIEARLGEVRTVIAVVKWWQRRQLHVLAAGLPTVERIYALTWNPPARASNAPYTRATWPASADRDRLIAEHAHLRGQLDSGELPPLIRDGDGWVRAGR